MIPNERLGIKERLEEAIGQVSRVTPCRSIAVARRDGLVIVHRLEPGRNPQQAAAMAAAVLGAATSVAKELSQGEVERVIIECAEGKVVALNAGPDAIILALYGHQVNLGLALHGLERTANTIDELLKELR
jgi:predicted regulator of Ras-like GTPase activity (Roadblock/LC7/MglB family)